MMDASPSSTQRTHGVTFKIIVVGKSYTGKTSFVHRWLDGHKPKTYKATIVSEYGKKTIKVNNALYTIQIWDIGGMDRNIILTKLFCKDCHAAIVLCDTEDQDSIEKTIEWRDLVNENIKAYDNSDIPILLIQNKSDLIIDYEENERAMKDFCLKYDIERYYQVSAKTGHNINEAMNYLIGVIIEKYDKCKDSYVKKRAYMDNNISLRSNMTTADYNEQTRQEQQKKKCC